MSKGYWPRVCRFSDMEYFGTEYGGWPVLNDLVDEKSTVLSFGLGEDISFDLGLISKFGCRVIGFDPTPKSVAWLSSQSLPEEFEFINCGLAAETGVITFNAPQNPEFASYSAVQSMAGSEKIELPVKDLATIVQELRIQKIDVLKMDIEGSENGVIQSLAESKIHPSQILVEFHHRIHKSDFAATRKAIQTLESIGYLLFYVSDVGDEFAFVHQSVVPN